MPLTVSAAECGVPSNTVPVLIRAVGVWLAAVRAQTLSFDVSAVPVVIERMVAVEAASATAKARLSVLTVPDDWTNAKIVASTCDVNGQKSLNR